MKLAHVLLPCKMTSRRIPRKNLATVGRRTLLDLAIDRFERWFPEAIRWVATEDPVAISVALTRGCRIYPLTPADIEDRRNGSELFNAWLAEREPHERCLLYQLTSPFTFRSELQRAVDDSREFCDAAHTATLHFTTNSDCWTPLSQHIPDTTFLTGNFYVANGKHVVTPREEFASNVPVNRLSAIQIDTPADLALADFIAARIPLKDFDDTKGQHE